MTLFDSRNVLDRVETTWKMIFNQNWKQYLFPLVFGNIIATWIAILFLYPLFRWTQHIDMSFFQELQSHFLDHSIELIEPLIYVLVSLTLFVTIGGIPQTYTISWHHNQKEEASYKDIMLLAWSRLWAWMWYSIWITLGVLLIGIGGIFVWVFARDFSWIYAIATFVGIYWALIACNTGFPAYIITNSASPKGLISLLTLTNGRWWRVLGNTIIVGMILSSVIGVGQQLLFSLIGGDFFIGKIAEGLQGAGSKELGASFFQKIFSDIGIFTWIRIVFGYTLIMGIYYIQNIFISTFNYLTWKEIITELPVTTEVKSSL